MKNTYFFISDIHLGLQSEEIEKKKERLLVNLLYYASDKCSDLFIVGDLFDYWFEYKYVYQKGFFRTLTALQDLHEKGIKIHYLIGNHDFMHYNFFKEQIGVQLYYNPIDMTLNNKRFFIGHGDGMVDNDLGYNIIKKILRNRVLQRLYSWIHPDLGISLASRTSKTSREYTSKKDYGETDGLYNAAKKKIDEGVDYVIFGHLHKRHMLEYKNGCYINLGSWLDKPCYGIFQDNSFNIVDWD